MRGLLNEVKLGERKTTVFNYLSPTASRSPLVRGGQVKGEFELVTITKKNS